MFLLNAFHEGEGEPRPLFDYIQSEDIFRLYYIYWSVLCDDINRVGGTPDDVIFQGVIYIFISSVRFARYYPLDTLWSIIPWFDSIID